MGSGTRPICMFCCDVLRPQNGQVDDLKIFAEFCNKVLNIGEALPQISNELSACSKCISLLKNSTLVREGVIEVKRRVSNLQASLLAELKELQREMKWFGRSVKFIADVVDDSNFPYEENDTVRKIRGEILNVSKNLTNHNNSHLARLFVEGRSGAGIDLAEATSHVQRERDDGAPTTTSSIGLEKLEGFSLGNPSPVPIAIIINQNDNSSIGAGREESVGFQLDAAENIWLDDNAIFTDTSGVIVSGGEVPSETFFSVGDDMIEIGDVKMVHPTSETGNGREELDSDWGESDDTVSMEQWGDDDDERDLDYTPESNLDANNRMSESGNSQNTVLLGKRGKQQKYQFVKVIPPQFQAEAENPNSWGIVNQKTGKQRCKRCVKEFSSVHNFKYHYNTVHLQMIFKCTPCSREFRDLSSFYRHYNACHLGMTFKCGKCNKIFTFKENRYFMSHQRSCGGTIESIVGSGDAVQSPFQPSHAPGHSLEERTGKCEICSHQIGTGSQCSHQRAVHPEPATASSIITRKRKAQPAQA